jgi:hypothetical protein
MKGLQAVLLMAAAMAATDNHDRRQPINDEHPVSPILHSLKLDLIN